MNLSDGNWTLDHDERFAKGFSVWDVNNDGFIDANEVNHQNTIFVHRGSYRGDLWYGSRTEK